MNSNKEVKKAFIRGFFDDEGTVDERQGALKFYSSNKDILLAIKEMLMDLGIKSTKVYFARCYILAICDRRSVKDFIKLVDSDHPLKRAKLYKTLKNRE